MYKNEVLVHVDVNGLGPLTMMLDTGTDPSAIDLATAAKIGVKRSTKGHQGSGGGTDKNPAFECKLTMVKLGGLTANNVAAAAIDLSKISERMGRQIDGILGHSLLNKRIVQFDYPHGVVRFLDKMPPPTAGSTTVSFRYRDNVLIDGLLINGERLTANLDTGSGGGFQLAPKAVERLGLTEAARKAR
ncbi:MAG TPA: retropepsin-like aspartic protease [Pyrinomonadaceae bacterium]|nr:retropepsin-like aspartic protease [Pyrinomonadaceae bacterium]